MIGDTCRGRPRVTHVRHVHRGAPRQMKYSPLGIHMMYIRGPILVLVYLCPPLFPFSIAGLVSRQDHLPHSHAPIRTPAHHPPLNFPVRLPGRIHLPPAKPRHDCPTHRGSSRHMHVPRKRWLEGVYVDVRIERGRHEMCRGVAWGKGERGDASCVVRPFVGAFLCEGGRERESSKDEDRQRIGGDVLRRCGHPKGRSCQRTNPRSSPRRQPPK